MVSLQPACLGKPIAFKMSSRHVRELRSSFHSDSALTIKLPDKMVPLIDTKPESAASVLISGLNGNTAHSFLRGHIIILDVVIAIL